MLKLLACYLLTVWLGIHFDTYALLIALAGCYAMVYAIVCMCNAQRHTHSAPCYVLAPV
jgi:hypothetical protein